MPKKKKTAQRKFQTTVIKFANETKVHPGLKEYFGYCLIKASAWLRKLHDEELKNQNIQTHHLGILKILEIGGPISQIQLGEELGIDKASMVKLIDHLEKYKYVERRPHPTDRRIKNVKMTKYGLEAMGRCSQIKTEIEKKFFKNLTVNEQEQLRVLISRLLPDSSS